MNHILKIALFITVLILGGTIKTGVATAEALILDTMTVTSEKEDEKKTIDKRTLKTHKVVDLAEILSAEMVEACMIRKGASGNEVSIRGFGQSNLRTLVDEGILEGACGSRKDPSLSHINMLNVEKIDITQGPFDVTRPGALGGSINVTTRTPQKDFSGEMLIKRGSFDFQNSGFYVTGGNRIVKGLIGYTTSRSGQYEDGHGNPLSHFASTGRPFSEIYKDRDAFEKEDFWGKISITPFKNHTVLFSHTTSIGEDILLPRVGMDIEKEETDLTRVDYTISELGKFSQKLRFSVYRNAVNHHPSDKYRDLVGAPAFHRYNKTESVFTGGSIQNFQKTGFCDLLYGMDLYHRNWKGDMYRADTDTLMDDELIPDVDVMDMGIFLKADHHFKRWYMGAGIRYDRFETEANENLKQSLAAGITENKQTDDLVSGFLYSEYFMTDTFSLFGGIGESVRTPTAVERYLQSPSPYFHGNPKLDATRNTEIDLGFKHDVKRFHFRLKGFYSMLEDFIYQQGKQTETSHQTWANIDATLYGADVKCVLDITGQLSTEISAAWQRGRKRTQPELNGDRNLAQIPPFKSRFAINYEHAGFYGVFECIRSEDAEDVDMDAGEIALDSWHVFNVRAGYDYRKFSLNIGMDNIFDRKYAVANSYEWDVVAGSGANPSVVNEPGRFVYATVSCRL